MDPLGDDLPPPSGNPLFARQYTTEQGRQANMSDLDVSNMPPANSDELPGLSVTDPSLPISPSFGRQVTVTKGEGTPIRPGQMSREPSIEVFPHGDPAFVKQNTNQDPHYSERKTTLLEASDTADASTAAPGFLGAKDMLGMTRVGAPAVSPMGGRVCADVKSLGNDLPFDKETNQDWSRGLWFRTFGDDGGMRPLTNPTGKAIDHSPVWLDEQTIAFLSTRSGTSQIWTIRIDGGEASQLTTLPIDVSTFKVNTDRTALVLACDVYPIVDGKASVFDYTAQKDKELAENPPTHQVYTALPMRNWDVWVGEKRSHIFLATLVQNQRKTFKLGSSLVDLMRGMRGQCPTPAFGGSEEFDVSISRATDDASTLVQVAFATYEETDLDNAAWGTNTAIYAVDVTVKGGQASVSERTLISITKGRDGHPTYSPDGSSLAFTSMLNNGSEADRNRLFIRSIASGVLKEVAADWTLSPGELIWGPHSNSLFVTADSNGRHALFHVKDIASKSAEKKAPIQIYGQCTNRNIAHAMINGVKNLVFTQSSFNGPNELRCVDIKTGTQLVTVSEFNKARLSKLMLPQAEELNFTGALNEQVHAWYLPPANYTEMKVMMTKETFPLAVVIHGGPQGAISDGWHYRWNPQVLAAHGFGVLCVNFHGSTGYGQAFTDSIRGEWGSHPYEDVMKGTDAALAKYGYLDSNRVVALGASYGGFMINWVAGHTNRFKCLVNHDGVFDLESMYYTTEELFFCEWEFKGLPETSELYKKWNPARFVSKWETPMLVIHGGKDYRVPEAQGMGAFTALQRKRIPSRFLYFEHENHWVLQLNNSLTWHDEVISWLIRFTTTQK